MKNLIAIASLILFSFVLTGQDDIQTILTRGNDFVQMCREADKYFEKKHPNFTPKELSSGEYRDGEFVKYMRWKNYWKDSLNPDGTFGDFAVDARAELKSSSNNDIYNDVEWSNISNDRFINLQISMGRTSSIGFHPTDENIFYVGADIGGVWKTTDGGQTYTAVGDDLPYLAVSSIVVDQENPNIIYISLGSHIWNGLPSIGVYKSADAGETWGPTSLVFSTSQNTRIYWLAADPDDSSTLLAATQRGLYKTTDGFASHDQVTTTNCVQAHYKPGDNSVVYLGTNNGAFLKSTDGGDSFSLIRDFGNNTVRIALTAQNPDKVVITHGTTLAVSTDAGESFSEIQSLPETFAAQLASISPQNPDDYIVGYFDLYRSTDGSGDYQKISDWLGRDGLPLIHVDMRNTFVNPLQNDRIYFCHDGGVDAYNVETGEFINLSDGLIITQFYDIAVSQSDMNVVSGGSQDNGSMYRDSNGTWDDLAGTGDGMISEIDPNDENVIYWEYQLGGMRRYDGSNNTNTNISPPNEDGQGAWITPYRLDPSNPNRIVVGYSNVYESMNRGNTWTPISGQLANGVNLSHIAIAESNGERIYAINGNNLYVKSIDTDQWTTKRLPAANITDIEVSPADMDKIVITIGGYSDGSKVYVSDNAGDDWSNISGSLPNVRFGAVEYYRDIDNALFIGSDVGVYYRDDSSAEWLLYGSLPHTRINDIEIQYSSQRIRVGTYGRGIFEAAIDIASCDENSPDQDGDGVCDLFDICPDLDDKLIGTACDDGDPLTSDETYSDSCICEGGRANLDYCSGAGSPGTGADYISIVQLSDLSNTSGQTSYSDFRNLSAELRVGATYMLTIVLGFAFDLDVAFAWIDYDGSSTFDPNELITMSAFDNNASTGTFTVPDVGGRSVTTMRVRSIYGNNVPAEPCGDFFGEVEDYTIRFLDADEELEDIDQDGYLSDVDCDDTNPDVNPNAMEIIYNGIDDDCNPLTLDDDIDQDGFLVEDDCDDNNPDINPDAEDIPNNGVDEDCDGEDMLSSTHELSDVEVNIYPNPASKLININVAGQLHYKAQLYDLSGQLIGTYINTDKIDVGAITSGIYLLEIIDLRTTQKIVERILIEE